ncbi:hypothetical protein HMPREF0294_1075 [Corynebacterium glucuronolyticum ATCC 51867]|nr:hypothetical protein HMPREF0294_1075 [Corynebacterium glucuronolyticum ATCC 51867]
MDMPSLCGLFGAYNCTQSKMRAKRTGIKVVEVEPCTKTS